MSTSLFFSCKVTGKKPTPFVPRPVELGDGEDEALTLSQACIPASCPLKPGTRVSLNIKVGDGEESPVAIATMVVGHLDTVVLSNLINEYTEFTIDGPPRAEVHITGFFNPINRGDEGAPAGLEQLLGMPSGYTGEEDEDDDDDDDDEEEDDDDMEEEEGPPHKTKRGVEITDITGMEEPGAAGAKGQAVDPKKAEKVQATLDAVKGGRKSVEAVKKALQQAADKKAVEEESESEDEDADGDEDEDDDIEEDDESGEGDSEEDDEEEEEEEEPKKAEVKPSKNGHSVKENMRTQQPSAKISGAKRDKPSTDSTAAATAEPQKRMKNSKFANGFQVIMTHETSNPDAAIAQPGKRIAVRYRGTLENGKVFDETKGNKKFTFRLGAGEVIKGWDRGVVGMRVGDKRKLIVPPSMAYGSTGVKGVIPKNATLTFEVEMVDVK